MSKEASVSLVLQMEAQVVGLRNRDVSRRQKFLYFINSTFDDCSPSLPVVIQKSEEGSRGAMGGSASIDAPTPIHTRAHTA